MNTLIEKYEKSVERNKALLEKLINQRNELDTQIQALVGNDVIRTQTRSGAGHRKFAFPRGVITKAAFEVLAKSKKPMLAEDVLAAVKKHKSIDPNNEHLEGSLRNILNASPRFKNVGNGLFTVTSKELSGALFERLEMATF